MVSVSLAKKLPRDVDAVIVGLTEVSGTPALVDVPEEVGKAFGKQFGSPLPVALDLGAKSTVGNVTLLPTAGPRLVVVGLGDVDVTPEQVRRAVGNGVRALAGLEPERPLHVAVSLDLAEPEVIKGAVEGALLGGYRFTKVGSEPKRLLDALTVLSRSDAKDAVTAAVAISAGVNQARDWVNTPANLLDPQTFAAEAEKLGRQAKLAVTVLDEKALTKEGFGGILAVGGGSAQPPRLVRLSYAPRSARTHLALVGKGITFDTGGINLKPSDSMLTMKSDMSGAAAVIAAVSVIAQLGLKVKVTAYAALAENMPSGTAYRPSDVLTMYGGTTVENYNSDAEGRLVMADALARASEDQPDLVLDVATLTGACVVALGERTAGLMATDDQTADLVLDAAEAAGEAFWQLPITDEASDVLKSKVADLRSAGKRWGGALSAAAFLREFVADDIAWAHLDIAGPAFNEAEAYDYVPTGGTGVAVRTLVALAQSLQG
ncbi:MAG: leucyl aminopeptidase [Actinomycetia bacterium]|nr:leucyl aminopeptidase [Actinomycetes bacterium]